MGPNQEQRNSTGRSISVWVPLLGGLEEGVELRDSEVLRLPPEKQIQREEEVQTPPRRELRRNEGHQPRGPRITTDESGLGPVDLADQQRDTAGRN